MSIYYKAVPEMIQDRESSTDSRSSASSKRSSESYHPSTKSNMGYAGSSSSNMEKPIEQKYRAPDAGTYILETYTNRTFTNNHLLENKYISSTTRGNVQVINQQRRGYDSEAPRLSDATSADYERKRREGRKQNSTHHSSHKHPSHRW